MDSKLYSSDLNIQATIDVRKMAELGWFDMEYTMYGCAYLNDKKIMCYRVSSKESDIYDFIEKSARVDIYPSNVVSITRKYPVPSGMKDIIANEIKKDLARELKDAYSKQFFEELYEMAQNIKSNQAKDIMWRKVEQLEGHFDKDALEEFEELLHYTYTCQKLSRDEYKKLMRWIKEERKNISDDFVDRDIFEKNMYGVGYLKDGQVKYIYNAQKEYVYRMMYKLEEERYKVGNVYKKTYWYNNYSYRLTDVIRDYKENLRHDYNMEYLKLIEKIKDERGEVRKEFMKKIDEMQKCYGEYAIKTMKRYGHRWGIL